MIKRIQKNGRRWKKLPAFAVAVAALGGTEACGGPPPSAPAGEESFETPSANDVQVLVTDLRYARAPESLDVAFRMTNLRRKGAWQVLASFVAGNVDVKISDEQGATQHLKFDAAGAYADYEYERRWTSPEDASNTDSEKVWVHSDIPEFRADGAPAEIPGDVRAKALRNAFPAPRAADALLADRMKRFGSTLTDYVTRDDDALSGVAAVMAELVRKDHPELKEGFARLHRSLEALMFVAENESPAMPTATPSWVDLAPQTQTGQTGTGCKGGKPLQPVSWGGETTKDVCFHAELGSPWVTITSTIGEAKGKSKCCPEDAPDHGCVSTMEKLYQPGGWSDCPGNATDFGVGSLGGVRAMAWNKGSCERSSSEGNNDDTVVAAKFEIKLGKQVIVQVKGFENAADIGVNQCHYSSVTGQARACGKGEFGGLQKDDSKLVEIHNKFVGFATTQSDQKVCDFYWKWDAKLDAKPADGAK